MNIPYDEFYQAELAEGSGKVDAVTSATKNKPRTGNLAGGSYHQNPDGTDIRGIIYPVFVKDMAALSQYKQITDDSSVDITVTNRGVTSTTTYKGKEALFESPDYSYYILSEKPAIYKKWNDDKSFSAVSARASKVEGVTGKVTVGARHANVEIALSGTEGIAQGDPVSAVIVTDSDEKTYGLRHVANLWRATEIGWNFDEMDLTGKSIKNIRYITQTAVIDYPVEIGIQLPQAIAFDQEEIKLENVDDTVNQVIKVTDPAEGLSAPAVAYTSQDESVVKVERASIKAVGAGTTTITASCKVGDKELTAECKVTVVGQAEIDAAKKKLSELSDSSDEKAVQEAREAYDGLKDAQKAEIPNDLKEKLEAQEKRIADQKAEARDQAGKDQEAASKTVKISSIKLTGLSHKIAAGRKIALKAKVLPANATNKKLVWKVNNKKLASVNQAGLVKLKKKAAGKKVIVTALAADGSGVKASFKIKGMKGLVKKIKITGKKKVKAGKTLKLKAKVKASKGANKKLQWTSSNPNYATVTPSGKVKALPAGKGKKVKITVRATDGSGKKKRITIRIK